MTHNQTFHLARHRGTWKELAWSLVRLQGLMKCEGWVSDQTSLEIAHRWVFTSYQTLHMLGWGFFFLFFYSSLYFFLVPSPALALPLPAPFLSLSLTLGLFDWKGLEQIRSRAAASRGLAPTQVCLDVQLRTVLPALGLTRGGGGFTENGQTLVLR